MSIKSRIATITIMALFSPLLQAEYHNNELVTLFDNVTTDKQTYNQLKRNNISMATISDLYNKILLSDSKENIEYACNERVVVYLSKKEKRILSVIINEPGETHSCTKE